MPTLLTTTLPPQYIGEATVVLPIDQYTFHIHLRFTVFGELLEYQCPELEMPEAALVLTFSRKTYHIITAELKYLPYRLLLMAFEREKVYSENNTWKEVKDILNHLKQGKHLYKLGLAPVQETAKEIVDNRLLVRQRKQYLKTFTLLYKFALSNDNERVKMIYTFSGAAITPILPTLIETLNSNNYYLKQRTIYFLGRLLDIRATPPLLNMLLDSDVNIVITAANALDLLKDPASIAPLLHFMQHHEQQQVRAGAALALAKTLNKKAIQLLLNLLSSADSPFFTTVLEKLIEVKNFNYKNATRWHNPDDENNYKPEFIQDIIEKGIKETLPVILAAIENPNAINESTLFRFLLQFNITQAIPTFENCLNSSDEYLRLLASKTLAKMGSNKGVAHLVAALNKKGEYDFEQAAKALSIIGAQEAVEPLLAALTNLQLASAAAEALGVLKDERAIKPLIENLCHPNSEFHHAARNALIAIGKPAAEPLLLALNTPNTETRKRIADVMSCLGSFYSIQQLMSVLADTENMVCYYLSKAIQKHGEKAVEPLITVLQNPAHPAIGEVVYQLGLLKDNRAIAPIVETLKNPDAEVKKNAAFALSYLENETAFEPLLPLLADEDESVRYVAIVALAKTGGLRAVEPILGMLKDKAYRVRVRAIEILMPYNQPDIIPHIAKLLKDKSKMVTHYAAMALATVGDASGAKHLVSIIKEGPFYDYLCRKAIVQLGKPAAEALLNELNNYSPYIRRQIIELLGLIGNTDALSPLQQRLQTETHLPCINALHEAIQKLQSS